MHECAHRFLAEYRYWGRELIYSDPPYLQATHTSERRHRFDYEVSDHVQLRGLLKSLPCAVILCGYPSARCDESVPGRERLELQVMTQGGVHTEKLWFNLRPERVHWARCAGKNCTDRQRIKFKGKNRGSRSRALPPGERFLAPGDHPVGRRRIFHRDREPDLAEIDRRAIRETEPPHRFAPTERESRSRPRRFRSCG